MPEKSPWFTSRSDLLSVLIVGAIAIMWNLVVLVRDLIQLIPGRDVQVSVLLSGIDLTLPIGPGGSAVPAQLDSAEVTVSQMPVFVHGLALLAAVTLPLATIAVVLLVLKLCGSMLNGTFFSRGHTRIITAISLVIAVAWFVERGATLMTSNWALVQIADAAISDSSAPFEAFSRSPIAWAGLFAAMAVGALAAVFKAGERMQRDSEGLV